MTTKLIQLLDCEGEFLALYAYNGDLMNHEDATEAIDNAYENAMKMLRDANPDEYLDLMPGDVEGDADEALAAIGIERTYTDEHYSKHF